MRLPDWRLTPLRRTRLAVGTLLAVSVANAYLIGKDVWRLLAPGEEIAWEVMPYIEQLAPLREQLPADARISFVSAVAEAAGSKRDLFLTRYALAPRCVVPDGDAPLLLVHGAPAAAAEAAMLVVDLGNGFRLYRTGGPPP
jgi:hypothetical protein